MAQKKFNSVAGFSVGSPENIIEVVDSSANVYANRLTVTQTTDLGSVGNITIGGGSANYMLITDGQGNLSWSSAAGIETATGNATEIQYNDAGKFSASAGLTFDKTSNTLAVSGNITRDGKIVSTYVSSTTPPSSPMLGDQWYNQNNDTTYQYINDGVSNYWIDISSGFIASYVSVQSNSLVLRDANGNVYANNFGSSTITVSGKSYLNSVGNITITGGTAGQYLKTDGAGNLSWSTVSLTGYATETYVDTAINNLLGGAPGVLDTLNELASAINNDPNFFSTFTSDLSTKLNISDFDSTANTWLIGKTTDDVAEGANNLYYTNTRVDNRIREASIGNLSDVNLATAPVNGETLVWNAATNKFIPGASFSQSDFNTAFTNKTTDDLAEGTTNLYYTISRANTAIDNRVTQSFVNNLHINASTLNGHADTYFASSTDLSNLTTVVGTKLASSDFTSTANTWLSTQTTSNVAEGTNLYYTIDRANTWLATKTTSNVAEGTNLYYTTDRANTWLSGKTTDNLTEGTSNLYYTTTRANTAIDNRVTQSYVESLNITSLGTLSSLSVSGPVSLGSVANIEITGGLPGYVLTTDGTGNLSWAAGGSGSSIQNGFVSIGKDRFLATGSEHNFTLTTTPSGKNAIEVVIDGLQQISNTYNLTGNVLSFPSNLSAGQVIEVTTYGIVDVPGNTGEVTFNANGVFGSSSSFVYDTNTNTLSAPSITATGNLTSQAGYIYVDNSLIAVSNGNAGIFNTNVSNLNIGLTSNVTVGSSSGNVSIRGTLNAGNINVNQLSVKDYYSSRDAVVVESNTVIDQFAVNIYRSAKYTMRVNSDDGFQAVEVLLVHNGVSCYVTIYGSISSTGSDIISLTADIDSGNVRLMASTTSPNTNVKILGTYVPD